MELNEPLPQYFRDVTCGKDLSASPTVWCGSGCQQFLIGFCPSQVAIGDKTKLTELKGGPWLTFLPTFFCSKNRLGA